MEGVWGTTRIYTWNSGWVIPSILIVPKVPEIQTWCRISLTVFLRSSPPSVILTTAKGASWDCHEKRQHASWGAASFSCSVTMTQLQLESTHSISSSKHLPKVPKYSIISPGSAPDLKWLYASCMKVTPKINMTIPSSSIAQNKVFTDLRWGSYQLPRSPWLIHAKTQIKSAQMSHEKNLPLNPDCCFLSPYFMVYEITPT